MSSYSVLYYPRSTKTHKKKIKGKLDGTLKFDEASSRLSLVAEDDKTITGKLVEKGSGEGQFADGDVVALGKFEAEILNVIATGGSKSKKPKLVAQSKLGGGGMAKSGGGLKSGSGLKSAQTLAIRKRPLGAIGSGAALSRPTLVGGGSQVRTSGEEQSDNYCSSLRSSWLGRSATIIIARRFAPR